MRGMGFINRQKTHRQWDDSGPGLKLDRRGRTVEDIGQLRDKPHPVGACNLRMKIPQGVKRLMSHACKAKLNPNKKWGFSNGFHRPRENYLEGVTLK